MSSGAVRAHLPACRWFWAWAAVGFAAAVGFVSLGLLAFAPAAVAAAVLASRPASRRSAYGSMTGAGLLFVFVAFVQRAGPKTTCWQTPTASGCDAHLNPLPWLAVGLVLIAAGVVGHARRPS